MQTKMWITLKDTISLVDKWVRLSTNESTNKYALSTKILTATTISIKKNLLKTMWLRQTGIFPNKKTDDSGSLGEEKRVTPKSTHSTAITSFYIYNI
jgi:hypothetical protein